MDTNLEGMPRCVRSLRYGLLLERADDVDVKGSRTTTAPVREEDVCWVRLRTRDQTGGFLGGGQCGRLGSREDHIPDGIVAGYAVFITTTPDLVIPEGVSNAATFRTGERIAVERNP